MKLSLIRSGIPDLLPMLNRSPGIHVSNIISDICYRTGRYNRDTEMDKSKLQLGCALEHAICQRYIEHYQDRYMFGTELELDGIYGTSDIIDTRDFAVEEVKLSWISSKRLLLTTLEEHIIESMIVSLVNNYNPDDINRIIIDCDLNNVDGMYWQFIVQLMAYCKQLGTTLGRLHLCHVGFVIVYNVWEMQFEQDEIDEYWDMLRNHRDRMLREQQKG